MRSAFAFVFVIGCGNSEPVSATPDAPVAATADAAADSAPSIDAPCAATYPLQVRFLGVAGFLLQTGDQAVLTAPLFTRPSMGTVLFGSIASDANGVSQSLPATELDHLRAVVSGHAHYDHLLDAPAILREAPAAKLISNASAAHLLAALAPDRAATCTGAPAADPIARSRVIALDDPAASHVDYRACADQRPAGAPLEGSWFRVPGSRVRVYSICSVHPDQIGPYHFGLGSVDADQCELPNVADDWREGRTLALLIDFLDAADRPLYRVYYQDAPTTVPIGIPPAGVLAEKQIDLALLCVGNYDRVVDAPAATLAALSPRFALGGHWEDFFQPASNPPQPLPLTDINAWTTRAQATMTGGDPTPWLADGVPAAQRALLPQPGARFTIAPASTCR